jgi:O-acetylserine/cysteine efflux transporter
VSEAGASKLPMPGASPVPADTRPSLTLRASALSMSVALVWGTNPVAIHEGLKQFPPLGGAAIRFAMVAVPLALILPRPRVGPLWLAVYGLLLGAGLGFNNIAMAGHVSPGLASLLLQVQVALTIALELLLDRRLPRVGQVLALLLCSAGVLVIVVAEKEAADAAGVTLMIAAATFWAVANMIVRRIRGASMIGLMVWSSGFASLLLAGLSLFYEGPTAFASAIRHAGPGGWSALLWQAAASSLFGYASWNFLLGRYSASQIAPFALLVPVVGMAASALFIGEPLGAGKVAAAVLIVSAMAVAIPRKARRTPSAPPSRNAGG